MKVLTVPPTLPPVRPNDVVIKDTVGLNIFGLDIKHVLIDPKEKGKEKLIKTD